MKLPLVLLAAAVAAASAAEDPSRYVIKPDISYLPGTTEADEYRRQRCKLDVYHPQGASGCATVVWFHGGGLQAGERHVPNGLKNQGIAVVAVNYRLHPKAECPAYIEDAAAAVAWTLDNIARFGGDPEKVFVSGHSAGGYLASMVGLDKRWLAGCGSDPARLAGIMPLSGQTITHSTIRKERGIPETRPLVDELAPLYHVRADAPPVLLITGDREMEMRGRYEENALLMRMLKVVGHKDVTLYELQGYGHGCADPAMQPVLDWMRRHGSHGRAESP